MCPITYAEQSKQERKWWEKLPAGALDEVRPLTNGRDGCDVLVVTYTGKVLTTREENGHDDSDFYAIVWDGEKCTREDYATTCFAGGGHAKIDATPEVIALASKWLEEMAFQRWAAENALQCHYVKPGRRVRVVKGRKCPRGITGTVGVVEQRNFDPYRRAWGEETYACFDADPDENGVQTRYWTNVSNLEVLDPENYILPVERGREVAQGAGRDQCWHRQFTRMGVVL
jgi:hypothetical protein